MCGITGACWTADGEPLSRSQLEPMVAVLAHRGPDDAGFYESRTEGAAGCALGFRRLSIIDLAGGHQPLANEDDSIWIVFNGEIYNYRELQNELRGKGHRLRTACDTEVIVHLYEEEGDACVDRLRGMFAFALWDARRRRLLLARDRLGQKPLYYRLEDGRLLFASELKSLLQAPGATREVDSRAVAEFLTLQYVPHPGCILLGYNKLPPAHRAAYDARSGRLDVARYWRPPYQPDAETTTGLSRRETAGWSADRWRSELRERLTAAVQLRMRSDVPLGAFLSGGVDSTIISGLMQQLSDRPVHTFSIGFPVAQFDERKYAREAAEHLGTEHHEYLVEPSALETLPRLIWHYDEPFADSSAIPTMYLSKMTRQEVTVALSGDGGDELFGGYDRYRAVEMAGRFDRLPKPIRALLAAEIWQKIPASTRQRSLRRRAKRFLTALTQAPERRYLRWIGIFDQWKLAELISPEFRERLAGFDPASFLLEAYRFCPDRDFVTRTTCTDVLSYLPCDILTKVDVASMAASLECRSPFLDHHVAELAALMPIELKRRGHQGKRILIETFADLLPASIQHRSKMGFGVPLGPWFRDELRALLHETLLDRRALERGWFDPEAVRRLVAEHTSNRFDHSYRLWALLCFELWQRTFVDGPVPDGPVESIVAAGGDAGSRGTFQ